MLVCEECQGNQVVEAELIVELGWSRKRISLPYIYRYDRLLTPQLAMKIEAETSLCKDNVLNLNRSCKGTCMLNED